MVSPLRSEKYLAGAFHGWLSPPRNQLGPARRFQGDSNKEDENAPDVYCPGLLVIHYTRRRKPTAGEYAFAQDIAAQCALAIEKARLLTEAREAAALATERASTLDAVFQAMTRALR